MLSMKEESIVFDMDQLCRLIMKEQIIFFDLVKFRRLSMKEESIFFDIDKLRTCAEVSIPDNSEVRFLD